MKANTKDKILLKDVLQKNTRRGKMKKYESKYNFSWNLNENMGFF